MYGLEAIKIILANKDNSILYKRLQSNMLNMEKIIVSHSLVYVVSGTVEVQTYDYQKYTATEGELLFMPRDSYLISDYVLKQRDMEVFLFFFDHCLASEFLQNFTINQCTDKHRICKLNVSENILSYIDALHNVKYLDVTNAHLLKIKIFEFLHLICESNKFFPNILQEDDFIKGDVKTYMLEHYDKNLCISDWANLSGDSLSTFNRKFKKKYGLTPKKWLVRHKMTLAKEALINGASVSDCAAEFGYSNSSNFIAAFKEIYKTTPKQYTLN